MAVWLHNIESSNLENPTVHCNPTWEYPESTESSTMATSLVWLLRTWNMVGPLCVKYTPDFKKKWKKNVIYNFYIDYVLKQLYFRHTGLSRWLSDKKKNPPANTGDAGDTGSIPGSGRSHGRGNGNPLQYSCLKNPMDRGTWRAPVHGVTKKWTWLSNWAHTHFRYAGLDQ